VKGTVLFDDGKRRWVVFGRDPSKGEHIIDTNQYLVQHEGKGMLIDPGGVEIFPAFVAALSAHTDPSQLELIFASHQDPDVISSLALWIDLNPQLACWAPWVWSSFIPHYGGGRPVVPIADEGVNLPLGGSRDLRAVPAHYCHSSGHMTIFDPRAGILFSSDIGAALLPEGETGFFVQDFARHTRFMEGFHKRWMPSNAAKNAWVRRVRELPVKMLCPQHGSIFRGDDVKRFLDWFEALQVGTAVE
jgi:flavorubredoxin